LADAEHLRDLRLRPILGERLANELAAGVMGAAELVDIGLRCAELLGCDHLFS
jgi:hypothetical protein